MPSHATGSAAPARPRWLRLLRRLGLALVVLAALGAALHTTPARERMRRFLVRTAGRHLGAEVRLRDLDYRLWAGEVSLLGLGIHRSDLELEVGRAELSVSLTGRLSARVDRPRLTWRSVETAETVGSAAEAGVRRHWGVLNRFDHIDLGEGLFALAEADRPPWLRISSLSAHLAEADGTLAGRLAGAVQLDSIVKEPLGPVGVQLDVAVDAQNLRFTRLELRPLAASAPLSLDGRGRLGSTQPLDLEMDGSFAMGNELLSALATGVETERPVDGEAQLRLLGDQRRLALEATNPALRLFGSGPWDARVETTLDGSTLDIGRATLLGLGGRIEGSGRTDLGSAAGRYQARAEGLDMAGLAGSFLGAPVPVASRLGAELSAELPSGTLRQATGQGRVRLRPTAGRGLPVGGEIGLTLGGGRLHLGSRALEAGAVRLSLDGQIGLDGGVEGRFVLSLARLQELGRTLRLLGLPEPPVDLEGPLRLEGRLAGELPELRAEARVHSRELRVQGIPGEMSGGLRLDSKRLTLDQVRFQKDSGRVELDGTIPLQANGTWALNARLDQLDVSEAWAAVPSHRVLLDGDASLEGRQAHPAWTSRLRATVGADPADTGPEPPGVVELGVSGAGGVIVLDRLEGRLGGGEVQGSGRYDVEADALALVLQADDVGLASLPLPAQAQELDGRLGLDVALHGSARRPEGSLEARLTDLRFRDVPLPKLTARARLDGQVARVTIDAQQTLLAGELGLEPPYPVRLESVLEALPLEALIPAFPRLLATHATLHAAGRATLEGALAEAEKLRYAVRVEGLEGQLEEDDWRVAPFSLRGDLEGLELGPIRLDYRGSRLEVAGRLPIAGEAPLSLRVQGELPLSALAPFVAVDDLGGTASADLRFDGTGEGFAGTGELSVRKGAGRVGDAGWKDLEALAELRDGVVWLREASASLLGGRMHATGRWPIRPVAGAPTGPALELQVQGADPTHLLPADTVAAGTLAGAVDLSASLAAPHTDLADLSGSGVLSRLQLRSGGRELSLESPVSWELRERRLRHSPFRLRGASSELVLETSAENAPDGLRWRLAARGALDLMAFNPFLVGLASLSGAGQLDLDVRGGPEGVTRSATAAITGARLSLVDPPLTVSQLEGRLRLEDGQLRVEAARGRVGDGRLEMEGDVSLSGTGTDLRVVAESVPLFYPEGMRSRVDARLGLSDAPGGYRLAGEVVVSRAVYRQAYDAASQSVDDLEWQLALVEKQGSPSDRVALDVRVRLADDLRVSGRDIELAVDGRLAVAGSLAVPRVEGQLGIREGGLVKLGRARTRVTEGRVELLDYPFKPLQVDLHGLATVSGIPIELRARGALDDLQIDLSSSRTDLTQGDLATLLMTGRTASAAASQGGAIVAEELAVALGGMLQQGLGDSVFVDISSDQSLLSGDTDPTQRFNVGHAIGQNLYVIYSTDLAGGGRRWILEYRPGTSYRLRAISEEDNASTFEVSHRFGFDLWSRGRGSRPKGAETMQRIASIELDGQSPIPEPELLGTIRVKAGKRYDDVAAADSAERLRQALVERGYRGAVVDVETEASGPGEVVVRFRIEPGDAVALEWTGDDPGLKLRRAVEAGFVGAVDLELAAELMATDTRHRLGADRYYRATVAAQVVRTPQPAVRVHVVRGPRGRRVRVTFQGNQALSGEDLLRELPEPSTPAFFDLLENRGAALKRRLLVRYGTEGFLQAHVEDPETTFETASGELRIVTRLEEGPRALVASLALPEEVLAAEAPPTLRLAPGQPFLIGAYLEDRNTLASWYRGAGYLEVSVDGLLDPQPEGMAVAFAAETGTQARVAGIRLDSVGRTRPGTVRRAVGLSDGDLITPTELARSRERLTESRVYRTVDVRAEPTGDPGRRDLVVDLVDKLDLALEYGLRYTTQGEGHTGSSPSSRMGGRLQAGAGIDFINPFGLQHTYRVYGLLAGDRRLLGATFDSPTFFGARIRTQLFAYEDVRQEEEVAGLTDRVRTLAVQQTRRWQDRVSRTRWHDRLRLQWGYRWRRVFLGAEEDAVERTDAEPWADRGTLSLSLVGDRRDSFTDPHRGLFWTASSEWAATWLGSDVDYLKVYGQLFGYVPLGERAVWASALRLGLTPGDDPLLLLENRFLAGGANTVRGFPQDGLGPRGPAGNAIGGQAIAVFNQELRFPIFRQLHGGVFYDTGNVFALARDLRLGELRHSAGVGLRYMLPFGPVRLDWAYVLDPEPGEQRSRLVFSLGHAF